MFSLLNIQYKSIINVKELHIPQGKITCIQGESGSGKSTLLKLLNRMLTYTAGDIYYKEKDLKNYEAIDLRREVMMLPQVPAIYDGSILNNLKIGFRFAEKREPEEEMKYSDILRYVGLDKELNMDAMLLSGGEKQRLAMARLMLLDPEVYLLDEPSSALDQQTEEAVIGAVVEHCKKQKKTLIMVTHSPEVADKFAEYRIYLKKGQVVREVSY